MFTFAQWRNSHYDYKQTEKQQQNRDMAVAERPADDDHHEQTANIPSRAQLKIKSKSKTQKTRRRYPFQGSGREFELVSRFVVGPIPKA